ncbi:MAG: T9SS type A sorting domain-containing protein [candidate division WOR-3 bacterium]
MAMQRKDFNLIGLVPCVLVSLFFISTGLAQITWQRTYGGASSDYGYSVQQTTDGGYIVAGYTDSFGNSAQVYLIKTDSLGDTLWTRTYGGSGDDFGMCVRQTTDVGYIIVGYTNSFGNGVQAYLIKTDSLGDTLWTKTYDEDTISEFGVSVRQTTDRGYIITGWTYSDVNSREILLIKTDSLGSTLWTKTYGGAGRDRGRAVEQTQDGGYIIIGDINSPADRDPVYLIKTDSLGDTLWTKIYGSDWHFGYSVQQTYEQGYIVAGGHDGNVYLVKTDSLGDTIWSKEFKWGTGAGAHCVKQTTDHCYIIAGWGLKVIVPIEYYYLYLVKTDSLGDTLWSKVYGDGCSGQEGGAWCVQQTADGGYILVGTESEQVYLVKTDQNGNVAGIEEKKRAQHPSGITDLMAFPNPFTFFTTIIGYEKAKFFVYDVSGRRVAIYPGNKIGFGLPSGVYFLIPEGKGFKPVRVVKMR